MYENIVLKNELHWFFCASIIVEKLFVSNQGLRYNERKCILGSHSNMPRTVTLQRYRTSLDYTMFYFADGYNCMDRPFKILM